MINKGIKHNLEFIIEDFTKLDEFQELYTIGMKHLNATPAYMYDIKYFELLSKCNVVATV